VITITQLRNLPLRTRLTNIRPMSKTAETLGNSHVTRSSDQPWSHRLSFPHSRRTSLSRYVYTCGRSALISGRFCCDGYRYRVGKPCQRHGFHATLHIGTSVFLLKKHLRSSRPRRRPEKNPSRLRQRQNWQSRSDRHDTGPQVGLGDVWCKLKAETYLIQPALTRACKIIASHSLRQTAKRSRMPACRVTFPD